MAEFLGSLFFSLDAKTDGLTRADRATKTFINSMRQYDKNIVRAANDLGTLSHRAYGAGNALTRMGLQGNAAANQLNAGLSRSNAFLGQFSYLLSGVFIAHGIRQTARLADEFFLLDQRVKVATRNTNNFSRVYEELYDISQSTGTSLSHTIPLYQDLVRAAPALNKTVDDILIATRAISQVGVVSGSDPIQQKFALRQLSQGLASGIFRAEEFNSLLENMPELIAQIAKGWENVDGSIGITQAGLRRLVLEQEATSEGVIDALLRRTDDIDKKFQGIQFNMARSFQVLRNSWGNLLLEMNESTGIIETVGDAFISTAETIDGIALQTDHIASRWEYIKTLVADSFTGFFPEVPEGDKYFYKGAFVRPGEEEIIDNKIEKNKQFDQNRDQYLFNLSQLGLFFRNITGLDTDATSAKRYNEAVYEFTYSQLPPFRASREGDNPNAEVDIIPEGDTQTKQEALAEKRSIRAVDNIEKRSATPLERLRLDQKREQAALDAAFEAKAISFERYASVQLQLSSKYRSEYDKIVDDGLAKELESVQTQLATKEEALQNSYDKQIATILKAEEMRSISEEMSTELQLKARQRLQDGLDKLSDQESSRFDKDFDKLREKLISEEQLLKEQYDTDMQLLKDKFAGNIKLEMEYYELSKALREKYIADLAELGEKDKKLTEKQQVAKGVLGVDITDNFEKKSLEHKGKLFREQIDQAAQHSREFFNLQKGLALATATVEGYQAIVSSYAAGSAIGGPPVGAIFAGIAAAATAIQIQAIASSQFQGGRAQGGFVGGSGFYEVNERGPELLNTGNRSYLMMNGQSGSVSPLGAASTDNVQINIYTNSGKPTVQKRNTQDGQVVDVFFDEMDARTAQGIQNRQSQTYQALQSTFGTNGRTS